MHDALPALRLPHNRTPAQDDGNERAGTPCNFLEHPTDIVLLGVLWRLRSKLSLRDLTEMVLERGFVFTHRVGFPLMLLPRPKPKRQSKAK